MFNMQDIIHLIQTVGFPIVVTIYLLWRYDGKIGKMFAILTEMKTQNETQVTLTGKAVDLLQTLNTNTQILRDRQQ
jgi:hypothetical protein